MKAYRAECDCGFEHTATARRAAVAQLKKHECLTPVTRVQPPKRCACCRFLFRLLVDDILCMECDSRLYPAVIYPATSQPLMEGEAVA